MTNPNLVTFSSLYEPRPLAEPAGSVAADLAAHAWNSRLTIYAGAGISAAPPTLLPGAAGLARRVSDALRPQIPLDGVDCEDLIAVADAVAAQPLGADLLRQTILNVADLRGAIVNYAHEVIGLFLCEGAATVFETNYDDCVERGAQPERPIVVRTAAELLQATGAALLKAHGCATQPETMLITQADLDSAPRWAQSRVAAQLGTDRVAFIGIGSPADYVRNSITMLLTEVGVNHVLLVDPLLADWDNEPPSTWRQLLPELTSDHRDARTAEEFCDALLRAYLLHPRAAARASVSSMPAQHPQRRGLEIVLDAVERSDSVAALRWLRGASYKLVTGAPVVTSTRAVAGLLGTGALLGDTGGARLVAGGWLLVTPEPKSIAPLTPPDPEAGQPQPMDGGIEAAAEVVRPVPVMLLLTHGSTLGAVAEAEARRRVIQARGNDVVPAGDDVVVVAVGHMGPMSAEVIVSPGHRLADVLPRQLGESGATLPDDLVADNQPGHLIDGVAAGAILVVNGDHLIEAA